MVYYKIFTKNMQINANFNVHTISLTVKMGLFNLMSTGLYSAVRSF